MSIDEPTYRAQKQIAIAMENLERAESALTTATYLVGDKSAMKYNEVKAKLSDIGKELGSLGSFIGKVARGEAS